MLGYVSCPTSPWGYYHDNEDSWECSPCPLGSTTNGNGKVSINQCRYAGPDENGSTQDAPQFCDNIGCFYLPNGTTIFYKGN